MLLSLHPNIIVRVENVVSLFSSPSTSSQKVLKCGGHNSSLPNTCVNFYRCFSGVAQFAEMLLKIMLLSLHPNIIVHV